MPNNTTNILTVTADSKTLQKIKKYIKGKEGIDFNKIIPMPKELKNVRSPVQIVTKEEYISAKKQRAQDIKEKKNDCFVTTLPLTQELNDKYMRKYGSNNWHDWAVANWDTKWDAYDIGQWEDNKITFYTAWSPPLNVIEKLSEKFPNAIFELKFADEGYEFVGIIAFQDGLRNEIASPKNHKEFRKLWEDITGMVGE